MSSALLIFVICCFLQSVAWSGDVIDEAEYCEDEKFIAKCNEPSDVIVISHAQYGRMRAGRCVTTDAGRAKMGCFANVLGYIDSKCSGRWHCELPVAELVQHGPKPCSRNYRSFLIVAYSCMPVFQAPAVPCSEQHPATTNAQSGYIANAAALNTGCGITGSPLVITAKQGLRINITLWDFSANTHGEKGPSSMCLVFATIKEVGVAAPTKTICGGQRRISHAYQSVKNKVEIRVLPIQTHFFLLHWEVVGCADPVLTPDSWFERDDNRAIIGCRDSGTTWQLECKDGVWTGTVSGCNGSATGTTGIGYLRISNLSKGMSIMVITGVALFVGLAVLIVGVACIRRYLLTSDSEVSSSRTPGTTYASPTGEDEARKSSTKSREANFGNTYFHTWQPYSSAGVDRQVEGAPPPPYGGDTEHVYESPTTSDIEQTVGASRGGRRNCSGPPQSHYFVLDLNVSETGPLKEENETLLLKSRRA